MRKLMILFGMVILLIFLFLCTGMERNSAHAALDFSQVEEILGFKGQVQEDVFLVKFPRSDLKMSINGESVPTALGFASWTTWKPMGKDIMVMGDLVLLEKEINPVISALEEAGIQVSALHNHFIGDQPHVMYMHISGMGQMEDLAKGIRNALDKTSTPHPDPTKTRTSQVELKLDTKRIEEIIGHSGQSGGGVFKITIGRPGVMMNGIELNSTMGLNSWAAFVGTDESAHVAGDIAMTAKEVNPVILALREGGIEVVAVHNHMLDEEPRIFFLHYWGTGPAEKLAQTLKEAFKVVEEPVK